MKTIRSIMCCCGVGLGSSMLVHMNVEKALKNLGISDVEVTHSSVSDATVGAADLFVLGKDLENFATNLPAVITLDNIISMPELESKLKAYLEIE